MVNKNLTKAGAAKTAPKTLALNPVPVAPITYPVTAVIRLTPKGAAFNPKRPGTAAYALYAAYGKGGLTVGAYLAAAARTARPKAGRVAIAWDVARGYITVS
jgi:hypothetical protein